ncbi:hypothetical protein CAPTEDRAFT_83596, partial [Capitella teleta]
IGVVGTGDFGRAFSVRVSSAGYRVVIGSRDPHSRAKFLSKVDPALQGIPVVTIQECIEKSNIVVFALSSEDQRSLALAQQDRLKGKIVVDVSNTTAQNATDQSQAEQLQSFLPQTHVIKAFNTVSAYALGEDGNARASRSVFVCGNQASARAEVSKLAVSMALQVVDMGGVASARALEKSMQTMFAGWGWATIVICLLFVFWLVFTMLVYHFAHSRSNIWLRFPSNLINKVFGCMALTLLALCYLPGCIVAIVQLVRGTKNKALPQWMCTWLQMRKQMGLFGLLFALTHCCLSLVILDPAYLSSWYENSRVTIPANQTGNLVVRFSSRMNWAGETTILFATLSTALYCIVVITSLPSVGRLLNWKEWNFVQTYMGLLCMVFACTHITVKGYSSWISTSFVDLIQSKDLVSQFLPWAVLLVRIVLWIPCINSRLWRIRRG